MKSNEENKPEDYLSGIEGIDNISPVIFYSVSPEKYFPDEDLNKKQAKNIIIKDCKSSINKTLTFYKLTSQY